MKFNFFPRKNPVAQTTNREGAVAWEMTPETALYAAVVTTSLSDGFYEPGDERMKRIRELVAEVDPAFTARLAVYARTRMHLRSAPLMLTVELARHSKGNDLVRKAVNGVVLRADEITEMLACYQLLNNRKDFKKLNHLSKQVQRGLGDAFNRFDEYQFAKYDRETAVTLRDALFLVHPSPKNEALQALFDKIASGTLGTPYTWETELSALGKQAFASPEAKALAFRAKWEELIDSGKLGYMALMRNLRNVMQAGVSPAHMERVCARLGNAGEVARSRQLPFRFLAAAHEVTALQSPFGSMVLNALEAAMQASAANIAGFDASTRVVLACDVSGSMQKRISPKSAVQYFDIGLVLAMLMQSRCKQVITGMFGDRWKTLTLPGSQILRNAMEMHRREGEVGYATNGYKVVDSLLDSRTVVDKIFLFTDCELWDSTRSDNSLSESWKRYKTFAPGAQLYLFNLAGNGTTPVRTDANEVYMIAGWSDKVFEVLASLESGRGAVEQIRAMPL